MIQKGLAAMDELDADQAEVLVKFTKEDIEHARKRLISIQFHCSHQRKDGTSTVVETSIHGNPGPLIFASICNSCGKTTNEHVPSDDELANLIK